jgi:hypothetical protein
MSTSLASSDLRERRAGVKRVKRIAGARARNPFGRPARAAGRDGGHPRARGGSYNVHHSRTFIKKKALLLIQKGLTNIEEPANLRL